MTALIKPRPSSVRPVTYDLRPLAAGANVFKGGLAIAITSGGNKGFYKQGDASSAAVAVGRFHQSADNTLGANGAISANVEFFRERKLFLLNNDTGSPCATSDRESVCHVLDDQTVTIATTGPLAGTVYDVTSEGVWVEAGEAPLSEADTDAAAIAAEAVARAIADTTLQTNITAEATARAASDALLARTFVFQPGGVAGNGIYTDWATLVASAAVVNGYRRILVDLGLVSFLADIPGGTWNFCPAGISGDVELVGKTSDAPLGGQQLTLTGACTIQGLSRVTNMVLVNKSSVATGVLLYPSGFGSLICEDTTQLLQSLSAAGPLIKIAAGNLFSLFLKTNSLIDGVFGDSGTNQIAVGGGFVFIRLFAQSNFNANQLNKTGGTVIVTQSPDCSWASQASAAAVVPSGGRQKGVTTLVSGVSPAITACIAAGSRIIFGLKTPTGDALTVKYAALGTDRSSGAQGSFKISALTSAGSGAVNTADTSVLDWEVIN